MNPSEQQIHWAALCVNDLNNMSIMCCILFYVIFYLNVYVMCVILLWGVAAFMWAALSKSGNVLEGGVMSNEQKSCDTLSGSLLIGIIMQTRLRSDSGII